MEEEDSPRREGSDHPASRIGRPPLVRVIRGEVQSGLREIVPSIVREEVGVYVRQVLALDFGRPLVRNLLTYAGWTTDVTMRPSWRHL